ncbi:hypothetical protein [Fictibacillus solisalsi]|uniref:hypothetical protein n=1 Tax=Fictibacillus solisalsi TaxID=459525 RepID=UPI000B7FDD43|nr:hypothetical protein [Fictibacillus solisalsi]
MFKSVGFKSTNSKVALCAAVLPTFAKQYSYRSSRFTIQLLKETPSLQDAVMFKATTVKITLNPMVKRHQLA